MYKSVVYSPVPVKLVVLFVLLFFIFVAAPVVKAEEDTSTTNTTSTEVKHPNHEEIQKILKEARERIEKLHKERMSKLNMGSSSLDISSSSPGHMFPWNKEKMMSPEQIKEMMQKARERIEKLQKEKYGDMHPSDIYEEIGKPKPYGQDHAALFKKIMERIQTIRAEKGDKIDPALEAKIKEALKGSKIHEDEDEGDDEDDDEVENEDNETTY